MDLSMQKEVLQIIFCSVSKPEQIPLTTAVKSNSALRGKKKYDNFKTAS